jgi:hypothetical protein
MEETCGDFYLSRCQEIAQCHGHEILTRVQYMIICVVFCRSLFVLFVLFPVVVVIFTLQLTDTKYPLISKRCSGSISNSYYTIGPLRVTLATIQVINHELGKDRIVITTNDMKTQKSKSIGLNRKAKISYSDRFHFLEKTAGRT